MTGNTTRHIVIDREDSYNRNTTDKTQLSNLKSHSVALVVWLE